MTYMRPVRGSAAFRAAVVLFMTVLVLVLSAILLPPKGSNAMPPDRTSDAPLVVPK